MLETYFSELIDPKDPLINYRQKSWENFSLVGLPKSKQEAFQYLRKKLNFPAPASQKELPQDSEHLVMLDGFFDDRSLKLPPSVVCMPLEKAMKTYGLFLQGRISKILAQEKDPFALMNGAFLGKGIFLYLPPKCKAALHLEQIYASTEMASGRVHIYLGKEAELTLTQNSSGTSGFSNRLIDCVLDKGAQMKLIDHANGDFQALRASLKRDSKFKGVLLGKVLRHSIEIELAEENAEAEVFGLAKLAGSEEAHIHARIEHKAANTLSRQHFKSVVDEKGRYSFEGKIFVEKEAFKTAAYQLNNNLVLSDEASANAKPNLEIFCDDVKASHGSTTGQLSQEEIFYMRSRGLSLKAAREWLINGFCQEITDHAR